MHPRPHLAIVLFALLGLSACGGGDYPLDAAAPVAQVTGDARAVDMAGFAASAASAVAPAPVASAPEPAQEAAREDDPVRAGREADDARESAPPAA